MMLSAAEPRRKSLVALFIDGEHAVDVDAETFAKSGLRPGSELTDENLHTLIQASEARRAREKALYLLEYRSYSQKELAEKVARTVSKEAARQAAEDLAEAGLVDDAQVARRLAEAMFGRKGYASARVKRELVLRGIDRELAEQITQESEPDPMRKIREIVERKYARALSEEKGRRRTAAALQRLGYRWEDIRAVLHEMTDEDEYY